MSSLKIGQKVLYDMTFDRGEQSMTIVGVVVYDMHFESTEQPFADLPAPRTKQRKELIDHE